MYKSAVLFVLVTGMLICARPLTSAQDVKETPKSFERPFTGYRVDLTINELADGKKINSRHYSMNIATGGGGGNSEQKLKIGTRVPVQSEEGKSEYLDLGTSIDIRLISWVAGPSFPTTIDVNAEISSLADPDQAKGAHPLLRQLRLSGSSPVIPEKLMVIASADDPDSKHEFQLTILATKLTP